MSDNKYDDLGYRNQSAVRDAVSKAGSSRRELTKAATNAFYGFNHRNIGVQVKPNSDSHGLTFFTRPRLNLSYDNIAGVRNFAPLLTGDPLTLPRAIRCILDPVSHKGVEKSHIRPIQCPMVDPQNPFIPLLSNLLISMLNIYNMQAMSIKYIILANSKYVPRVPKKTPTVTPIASALLARA